MKADMYRNVVIFSQQLEQLGSEHEFDLFYCASASVALE